MLSWPSLPYFWRKKKNVIIPSNGLDKPVRDHSLDYLWLLQQSNKEMFFLFDCSPLPPWFGPPLQTAYTTDKLSLWSSSKNIIATTVKTLQIPRGRLKGSLYLLTPDQFQELDQQRQVGVQCERKNVSLILPELDANGAPCLFKAWMYIGKKNYWAPKIDWDQTFHRADPEFILAKAVKDNRPWLNVYYELDESISVPKSNFKRHIYLGLISKHDARLEQQHSRAA